MRLCGNYKEHEQLDDMNSDMIDHCYELLKHSKSLFGIARENSDML